MERQPAGWRGAYKDKFPAGGWEIKDGLLFRGWHRKEQNQRMAETSLQKKEYSAFDLEFEFMLTEGANSGVKYFVAEERRKHRLCHRPGIPVT